MQNQMTRFLLTLCALASSSLAASQLAACNSCSDTEAASSTAELGPAAATYTVRGEVRSLPEEGKPPALLVHHEAIPEFKGRDGTQMGMKAMTMSFELAPAVETKDLAVDDKVEITFEVRWQNGPPLRITSITKLPKETKLQFAVRR